MKKPFFWEKAKKVLISKDKKLGKIITNYPRDFLFSKSDPFYTLARSIVGQYGFGEGKGNHHQIPRNPNGI